MSNPETLKVFAAEDIKMKDVPPGTPTPAPLEVKAAETIKMKDVPPGNPALTREQMEEKLPAEELERRQKALVEYTRLSGRYCIPHNKKSRWVTKEDLERVVADGEDMVAMCQIPRGKYSGIAALAHTQLEEKDPLRFFVLPNGMVIINPVVIDHTKVPLFKEEGCMSFPDEAVKTMVPRFNKIIVMYQTLARKDENSEPVLSLVATEELSGGPAHVFQHEISHLNGVNIYDEGFTAESCEWLGDGPMSRDKVDELYNNK